MLRVRSLAVLAVLLLCSCATGADGEEDGVIVRGDARADSGDDDEDTATEEDTNVSGEDSSSSTPDTATSPEDTGAPIDTAPPPEDTGPPSCTGEESEPNDTASTARSLAAINDCDGSGGSVSGVISSSSDVDLLTFDGTDSFGCSVNPYVLVTGSVTACIRAACKTGTTELSCKKGTATGGQCCGAEVEADVNCTGTTGDDSKITITVRGTSSAPTCASYSIAYHY